MNKYDDMYTNVCLSEWETEGQGVTLDSRDAAIVIPYDKDEMRLILPKIKELDLENKNRNAYNALVCFRVLQDPECEELIEKHIKLIEEDAELLEDLKNE